MSGIWHQLEDKWYNGLDSLDAHKIPVYSIVDPVDKILPSLGVFLVLLAGIGLALFFTLPTNAPVSSSSPLVIQVEDTQGSRLWNVHVSVTQGTQTLGLVTDDKGKISFSPQGEETIFLEVKEDNYLSYTHTLNDWKTLDTFPIVLSHKPVTSASFSIAGPGGLLLQGIPIHVSYSCPGNTPSEQTINSGSLDIDSFSCDVMVATIQAPGFQELTTSLTKEKSIITLLPVYAPLAELDVHVNAQNGDDLANVHVQLYREGKGLIEEQITDTSGLVSFDGKPFGSYTLTIIGGNNYPPFFSNAFVLDSVNKKTQNVTLLESPSAATVSVYVENNTTHEPLSDATIVVETPSQGVAIYHTNGLGIALVSGSLSSSYTLSVSHPSFHSKKVPLSINALSSALTIGLSPFEEGKESLVNVHVTSGDNLPQSGVHVTLYEENSTTPAWTVLPTFTDAGGNTTLSGMEKGTYFIEAERYPYLPVQSTPFIVGDEPVAVNITIPSQLPGSFTNNWSDLPLWIPTLTPCTQDCKPLMHVIIDKGNQIPSFTESTFTFSLLNSEQQSIANANAYLSTTDGWGGPTYTLLQKTTDAKGNVPFSFPPSVPGQPYYVTFYHPEYEPVLVVLSVQEGILSFQPAALSFALPLIPHATQSQVVASQNASSLYLSLQNALVKGNKDTILNHALMRKAIMDQQASLKWTPGEQKGITFSGVLQSVIPILASAEEDGQMILTVQSTASFQSWVQSIPFHATFSPPSGCQGDPLVVTGITDGDTLDVAEFKPIPSIPIQVSNHCVVGGIPVPLTNLRASVQWEKSSLGHVQLTLKDPTNGQEIKETLKEEGTSLLAPDFWTADVGPYAGTLNLIPTTYQNGASGNMTLVIQADVGKGPNPIVVEKKIQLKTNVTQLDSCIKVTPNPPAIVNMDAGKDSAEFIISTKGCGVPVDVEFCGEGGNEYCSGGSPEGKIFLNEWKLSSFASEKKILISRKEGTLPGSYDITVRARAGNQPYRLLARIPVEIAAPDSYAFSLQKTHFSLYGKNALDASDLLNHLLEEPVEVTAAVCHWMEVETGDRLATAYNAYSIASLATDLYIYGGGCGGPCFFFGLYVGLLVYLFYDSTVDLCKIYYTEDNMHDYVINLTGIQGEKDSLPPDALDVTLSGKLAPHFTATWALEKVENLQDAKNNQQIVGVTLQNKTGYADPAPVFLIMSLRATEHIHGDPSHEKAAVFCTNGDFGEHHIGPEDDEGACEDAENVTRVEKFHVRIKTAEEAGISPLLIPPAVEACSAGFIQGYTGEGAVPRIAFNWAWNDEKGIPLYACDVRNPAAIYCDGVQFNIDLMKRLYALDEFLKANNYSFDCPQSQNATPDQLSIPNPQAAGEAKIGVNSFGYDFQTQQKIQISGEFFNLSETEKDVKLEAFILPLSNAVPGPNTLASAPYSCQITQTLPGQTTFPLTCILDGVLPGNYLLVWKGTNVQSQAVIGAGAWKFDTAHYSGENPVSCDAPKTTSLTSGSSGINQWIDPADEQFGEFVNEENVVYTKTIPNIQALNDLLHFEALLIKDGYSNDFEDDFKHYYTKSSFADAPPWFKGGNGQPGYFQFYGSDDTLEFRNRHFEGTALPDSGKYRVDMDIDLGESWKFFDEKGNPRIKVQVNFVHTQDPSPNSPFYRLPFDGEVGIENEVFDRKGYGINYINQDGTINLNDAPVKTYANTASNTQSVLTTSVVKTIKEINTDPTTRGMLLHVDVPTGEGTNSLTFIPTIATPVIMRVSTNKLAPFTAFYQLAESGNPVKTGDSLTYWTGAPQCADFSGNASYPLFNQTPDRHGTLNDKRTDWDLVYGVDWNGVKQKGDAYLQTIFYTPASGSFTLLSSSSETGFLTSNYGGYSSLQILDGTKDIPFNNASSVINSIQDVFDLVGQKAVCLKDDGINARFFWNPSAITRQIGTTSIDYEWENLTPGKQCLAPLS